MAVSSSVRPSPNHSISHNFCSARPFDRHGSSVHSLHVECRLGFASKSRDKKMEGLTLSRNRTQKVCNNGASSRPSFPTAFRIRCDGAHGSEPAFELASEQIKKTQSSSEVVPSNTYSDSISAEQQPYTETGGGEGNGGAGDNGKFGFGGDGDSSGEGDEFVQEEEEGFGSLLNSEEVGKQVQSRGITLPPDMAEAAQTVGIRSLVLTQFMDLQGAKWPLGAAIRGSSMLRNRMLADQSFLFKLLTEIAIDSGCATFAEVQKRGDDFWNEFELYMADLVVGVVVDVTLVCMLAPFIQFRRTAPATGTMSQFSRAIQFLPSSVFEAATPGRKFSVQQRIASYFYKGIQYGAVGFTCGIIGQGVANSIMLLKRKMKKSDEKDVPVPPLVRSAALWGVFLAVSSNTRYQIVNGLERVVEGSSVAKRLPLVAMAFTICIRFANNTYGGMQFVDWARWSGVQ